MGCDKVIEEILFTWETHHYRFIIIIRWYLGVFNQNHDIKKLAIFFKKKEKIREFIVEINSKNFKKQISNK
jgi:hypothetical protein